MITLWYYLAKIFENIILTLATVIPLAPWSPTATVFVIKSNSNTSTDIWFTGITVTDRGYLTPCCSLRVVNFTPWCTIIVLCRAFLFFFGRLLLRELRFLQSESALQIAILRIKFLSLCRPPGKSACRPADRCWIINYDIWWPTTYVTRLQCQLLLSTMLILNDSWRL
jgi:hypothetical protein